MDGESWALEMFFFTSLVVLRYTLEQEVVQKFDVAIVGLFDGCFTSSE